MRSTSPLVTLHKLTVGHTMCRAESLSSLTCGRIVAKSVNSSGLISARGAAPIVSTRCLTAVLAASAASFQPVKAAMTWGRLNSGRRIQRMCSRSAIAIDAIAQNSWRNAHRHTSFARFLQLWSDNELQETTVTRNLSHETAVVHIVRALHQVIFSGAWCGGYQSPSLAFVGEVLRV
ncbi:unannotated protein [freshwater metagenome]|uniref:Unannotated protein n=1 Tax=freshwater metagenome TaxID=449393 RepID=A0A6J7LFM9_9ZZZZ